LNAAEIIAICALLFTIGSFWWLSARPGKLQIMGEPRSYAFAAQGNLILNLPLVFNNSRPLAAVAINLRLRLNTPGFPLVVPFIATRDAVQPKEDGREMAAAIVIQGRETRLICCEFISRPFDVVIATAINIPVTVDAFVVRWWRAPVWRPLLTFTLRIPEQAATQRNQYITYDNQLSDLTG
jgi:hypothetical protein